MYGMIRVRYWTRTNFTVINACANDIGLPDMCPWKNSPFFVPLRKPCFILFVALAFCMLLSRSAHPGWVGRKMLRFGVPRASSGSVFGLGFWL